MAGKKAQDKNAAAAIRNRKARHEYHVLEVVECGIALAGTEVKSLRAGLGRIDDAYARVKDGEVFLVGANIPHYAHAAEGMQHEPMRDRKLLLHKRQIDQIESHVKQKGKTVVPLSLYFRRGWAKCELGIVVGKRAYDKREAIRRRDQQRDIARELRRRTRRRRASR
jgi:SsrA-binding protein